MKQRKVTARARDGQQHVFDFDTEVKNIRKKTVNGSSEWYIEKYGMEKYFEIPKNMHRKTITIKIVEQEKIAGYHSELQEEKLAKYNRHVAAMESAKIIGLRYIIGCDCGDTKYFIYDTQGEDISLEAGSARKEKDEKLLKKCCSIVSDDKNIKMNLDANLGSYGGYEIDGIDLDKVIANAQKEIDIEKKEIAAKKEEENAKTESIFQKAKDTGERQELYRYSIDCTDRDEECDVDIVTVYAMPDGTQKKEVHHTY